MRVFRLSLLGILFAVVAQSALAMLTASFSPVASPWYATHIVVVMTTTVDGDFEVLESWKGDLSPGSRLTIPELIPSPTSVPIAQYPKLWTPNDKSGIAEQIPKQPAGSRMVLFLKRNTSSQGDGPRSEWSGSNGRSDKESLKISTVWIDGDTPFTFAQHFFTTEPLVLSVLGEVSKRDRRFEALSVEEFKRRVVDVLKLQREVEDAAAETDSRVRALRMKLYVLSEVFPARLFALEELGKSGPAAVGAIGEMLDDPAYAEWDSQLVDAMVKAGGKTVGDELNRRFERDVAFWERTGPSLRQGWWNENPAPDSPLRNQYGQTYRLIIGLGQIHYAEARNTAIELRNLWLSLPQLNDPSGLNQIVEACDALIATSGDK
jgi:hypothetical protein